MAKSRKKAAVRGKSKSSSSLKIAGKKYMRIGCYGNKSTASKAAKKVRESGYTARVIDGCLFKGPKRKPRKRR